MTSFRCIKRPQQPTEPKLIQSPADPFFKSVELIEPGVIGRHQRAGNRAEPSGESSEEEREERVEEAVHP